MCLSKFSFCFFSQVVLTRGFFNNQHQEYSVSKLESEYGNKLSELTIKIQSAYWDGVITRVITH